MSNSNKYLSYSDANYLQHLKKIYNNKEYNRGPYLPFNEILQS